VVIVFVVTRPEIGRVVASYGWASWRLTTCEISYLCQENPSPGPIHPKFDFKKHGNGIHPPIHFLFKCVSLMRPTNEFLIWINAFLKPKPRMKPETRNEPLKRM
jgi:hypothetical protein